MKKLLYIFDRTLKKVMVMFFTVHSDTKIIIVVFMLLYIFKLLGIYLDK